MDPDPTPDPTPFFGDFKDATKNSIFLSYNLPAGTLSSVLKIYFLQKICVKILFCNYFSPLSTFMKKGKDPDPEPYF
jgi:hypothetical protein